MPDSTRTNGMTLPYKQIKRIMIKKELKERMINEIMSEFEFEKVHAFMVINEEKFYEGV